MVKGLENWKWKKDTLSCAGRGSSTSRLGLGVLAKPPCSVSLS